MNAVVGIVILLHLIDPSFGERRPCTGNQLENCMNGATCYVDDANFPRCICPSLYTGPFCETGIKKYYGIEHIWLPDMNTTLQQVQRVDSNALTQNDNLTIECPVVMTTNQPKGAFRIDWYVNETLLSNGNGVAVDHLTGSLFVLNQARERMEGAYYCVVTCDAGKIRSPNINVKVKVQGSFSSNSPITYNVTTNKRYALKCPYHSYSHGVTYDWINISMSEPVYFDGVFQGSDGTLYFPMITNQDVVNINYARGIQCVISQTGQKDLFSNVVFLKIIDSAKDAEDAGSFNFPTSDVNMFITNGDTTELHCFPTGREPISIIWYKNTIPLASSGSIALLSSNRTLKILPGDRKTSEGNYTVVVHAGNSTKTFGDIRVYYIEYKAFFLASKQKASVTFDCTSSFIANQFPFKWYFNGQLVTGKSFQSRSTIHENGSLSIQQLDTQDGGMYQCFIDEKLASRHFLFVEGLPLPPSSVSITNCSLLQTNVSWSVISSPSFPASSFSVEMTNEFTPNVYTQKQIVGGSLRNQLIKNLTPGATLNFRVRGLSLIGEKGLPSKPSSTCQTSQGKPTKFPQLLQASPNKANGAITVKWKAFPRIDWNGGGCVFNFYTKPKNDSQWIKSPVNTSCDQNEVVLSQLGTYKLTDVMIQVQNRIGAGPNSTKVTSYSGQPAPQTAPSNIIITAITDSSVSLKWDKLLITPGSVDQYKVNYNVFILPMRKRRSLVRAFFDKLTQLLSRKSPRSHRVRRSSPPNQQGSVIVNSTHATISGLSPYIKYSFTIQGVNSGGIGPYSLLISTTTLYNVDVFFLLSLKFVGVNFTKEYEDKTSLKYRNLSDTITTGLKKDTEGNYFVRSIEVLSFREGSVVADVQITSRSNSLNGDDVIRVQEIDGENFKPYNVDLNQSKLTKESGFLPPNISVSNGFPSPGDTIEFKCIYTDGPRNPSFLWIKDNKATVSGVRHKIESSDKQSILTIRKIDPTDEGIYQCIVRKSNSTSSSKQWMLKVKPVITIKPRSLYQVEGESATFRCHVISGDITSMKLFVVHLKPYPVIIGENTSTIDNIAITNGNTSQLLEYQCLLVYNKSLLNNSTSKSEIAELTIVKPSAPKCPLEFVKDIRWMSTAVGGTDIQRCPKNATGQATRSCKKGTDSKPEWDVPNLGNCTSVEFQRLLLQAEAVVSPDYISKYNASGLLQVLENATEKEGLNGGDLDVSLEILSMLSNNSQFNNESAITSDKDQQNFMETCSNILDPRNTRRWIQYDDQIERRSKSLWNRLVATVNNYGLQLTEKIAGLQKQITTTNVVMRIDKVTQQNKIKTTGLTFKYEEFQSSLYLPATLFDNGNDHRVVSLVYRTLNAVMRLRNDTNTTQGQDSVLSPNTTIVTSIVRPQPTRKLKNKVKIVLQNKKIVDPVPPRTCVFWRLGLPSIWKTDGCSLVPSESNNHVTTCECDHLTVFASLMDPYGKPLPEKDRKALELISTIGCAISLFAILLTIVVTLFFWRHLKSPRTVVLVNMCVAIGIVCILVIAEGTARETKVGCTVMAVLLHYFLLAVFCWFLCEGLLLYFLIVKVIGGRVEEKLKFFVLLGWGLPLLVVGISLAATQTKGYGYHGKEKTACWLAVDNGLIWAFVGPAVVILLINIVVFIQVIRQMLGTRHAQSKSRDEKLRMGVKATAVILPLLGITWVFGLLAFNSATLVFKYIFAIFNSLQGLMIFIFHCLCNPQVREAVNRRFTLSSSDSSGFPKSKTSPNKHKNLQQGKVGSLPMKTGNVYEMESQDNHRRNSSSQSTQYPQYSVSFDSGDDSCKNNSKLNDAVYSEIKEPSNDKHQYENLSLTENCDDKQHQEQAMKTPSNKNLHPKEIEVKLKTTVEDLPGSPPLVSRENSLTSDAESLSSQVIGNGIIRRINDQDLPLTRSRRSSGTSEKEVGKCSVASSTSTQENDGSDSSADTLIGENEFQIYVKETAPISRQYRPKSQIFLESESESSSSDEEVVRYDLVLNSHKGLDAKEDAVIFLGKKELIDI